MKIKKETPHLFWRVSNYYDYDFIEEHKRTINQKGYVYALKLGRKVDSDFIKKVIEDDGAIIMKSPIKSGNKYYYCKVVDDKMPENKNDLIIPNYYDELLKYEGLSLEDFDESGRWFKIVSIKEIPEDTIYKFNFIKHDNPVTESAILSRTVHMYIKNPEEIEL